MAYLGLLLLNHLPGAFVHWADSGVLAGDEVTAIGNGYTALGAGFFFVGVWLARWRPGGALGQARPPIVEFEDRRSFSLFCLLGGWMLIYGLAALQHVPSLGAAIQKGGAVWILGVILALRYAISKSDWRAAAGWTGALAVFPVVTLVFGGFLSYGAQAAVAALSVLTVSVRRAWRVAIGVLVAVLIGMSLFVNYFAHRDDMRATIWKSPTLSERMDAGLSMFAGFKPFDINDPQHLMAVDDRLNQNMFIGLAEKRLQSGEVQYLHGASIRDALFALVPRAIWPAKPVYGGSPAIVSQMTGMHLDSNTSFGVGQVMELQVNFGAAGVIIGMTVLGWLIGFLDLKAALAEVRGDLGHTLVFFLPAVALLEPIGSLVELSGGAAAALVAAIAWRRLWNHLLYIRASAAERPGRSWVSIARGMRR